MPDKPEGTKESQRQSTEDPQVEDLKKRQDKLAEEKGKEKDVSGGVYRRS